MIKHTPWLQQNRKQRNKRFIKAKNAVTKSEHIFFTCHCITPADFASAGVDYNQTHYWIDLVFLSKKRKWTYQTSMISSECVLMDNLSDECWDKFKEAYPELFDEMEWTEEHSKKFQEFEKNFYEQIISSNESITVNIESKMHFDYRHGIGLTVSLQERKITLTDINKWIEDFWKNGEQLPKSQSVTFTPDEIKHLLKDTLHYV